ncbi:hypothetical protein C5E51_26305 [Nocardia nova]|nr:hypothetical protein C5E51_26305 [Nocardia nova]
MFENRFRGELLVVSAFEPNDDRDDRVWPHAGSGAGSFPAWRALFSAQLLRNHCCDYQLFDFETFFRLCENTYTRQHPEHRRFERYFTGDLRAGMRQRVGVWYESGMAETYLYACLVEAIEDISKIGVVLYDPRADWKLKADILVIMNGVAMRVSAYVGESEQARQQLENAREKIERERKENTSRSAQWNNAELAAMELFSIRRTNDDLQVVNGVRLFSIAAVNRLLAQMYEHAGVAEADRGFIPDNPPRPPLSKRLRAQAQRPLAG